MPSGEHQGKHKQTGNADHSSQGRCGCRQGLGQGNVMVEIEARRMGEKDQADVEKDHTRLGQQSLHNGKVTPVVSPRDPLHGIETEINQADKTESENGYCQEYTVSSQPGLV